jgi:hypothetical protein
LNVTSPLAPVGGFSPKLYQTMMRIGAANIARYHAHAGAARSHFGARRRRLVRGGEAGKVT